MQLLDKEHVLLCWECTHLQGVTQWVLSRDKASWRPWNCCFLIQHVSELRYQLFRAKKGDVESSQLPLCKDCLHMHALRAHRNLDKCPDIPFPSMVVGESSVMMTNSQLTGCSAPQVLQLLSCKCRCICKAPDWECLMNQMHRCICKAPDWECLMNQMQICICKAPDWECLMNQMHRCICKAPDWECLMNQMQICICKAPDWECLMNQMHRCICKAPDWECLMNQMHRCICKAPDWGALWMVSDAQTFVVSRTVLIWELRWMKAGTGPG